MVLLHPLDPAPLRTSRRLGVSVAGADSNFAIAMTRLGWPAIWLSAVSQDQLGDLVVEMIGGSTIVVPHSDLSIDYTGAGFIDDDAGLVDIPFDKVRSISVAVFPTRDAH